jgi:hypothetical protein
MAVTRTLGPLHFEDLEPKRFEDLVRQLAYDFKNWRRLEATGRAGSDDGFDARGFEIISEVLEMGTNDDDAIESLSDRLWLIQCKRERTITPAKLSLYLNDIRLADEERLHGIVFTAACDFSKKSRDIFRQRCESLGIEEWHLWGKAELEDMLFQPRNDSLLFAYFGISLTIRRRSQRTELRARLAMKRKAHRILEEYEHQNILLRSPDAHQYPYSDNISRVESKPLWKIYQYQGMSHEGLCFLIKRSFAYLSDDQQEWDAALAYDDSRPHQDPWRTTDQEFHLRQEIYDFWSKLPEANQAWLNVIGIVPFESILDIDDLGDEFVNEPHLYVQFDGENGPFTFDTAVIESRTYQAGGNLHPDSKDDRRVPAFPEAWRVKNDGA